MVSPTEEKFWKNVRRTPSRLSRGVWEASAPYKLPIRRNTISKQGLSIWNNNNDQNAVDCHEDQSLSITIDITAGHKWKSSSKGSPNFRYINGHPIQEISKVELQENGQLLETQQSSDIQRISEDSVISDAPVGKSEDWPDSWLDRQLEAIHLHSQAPKNFSTLDISIDPRGRHSSPQNCLNHHNITISPSLADRREVDSLNQRIKWLSATDWSFSYEQWWANNSEALPLIDDLSGPFNFQDEELEEEGTQLIDELFTIQDPLTSILDVISGQEHHDHMHVKLIREYKGLKDYEMGLVDRLEEIEHEMGNSTSPYGQHVYQFPKSTHEPVLPFETSLARDKIPGLVQKALCIETSCSSSESSHIMRAKSDLDLYNKRWEELKMSNPSATFVSSPPTLPFPTRWPLVISNQLRGLTCDKWHDDNNEHAWRLTTYKFFCAPFGIVTTIKDSSKSSESFGFSMPPKNSVEANARALKGLKEQMKLEKMRWHEDKLRALFGDEVAVDERAKAVWGAILDLKTKVDQALEVLERS